MMPEAAFPQARNEVHAPVLSRRILPTLTIAAALAASAGPAYAGMPAPFVLTDLARQRVEVISFFVVALLLAAGAIQSLWNMLRRDFTRLPRLGYGRALGVVVLWGLLFVVVLAMISGARELMTPGAWQRDGATYRLADDGGR
jgi:hypothetical protein